jgi:hypothetical protein
MKTKKLTTTVKNIPSVLKSQPKSFGDKKYDIHSLDELKVGANSGAILSCKISNAISKKGEVPA